MHVRIGNGKAGFKPRLLLHLFDHLISPILSYGCEIWGNHDWNEIEMKLKNYTCQSANLF